MTPVYLSMRAKPLMEMSDRQLPSSAASAIQPTDNKKANAKRNAA
jgi:hypothetical protein